MKDIMAIGIQVNDAKILRALFGWTLGGRATVNFACVVVYDYWLAVQVVWWFPQNIR